MTLASPNDAALKTPSVISSSQVSADVQTLTLQRMTLSLQGVCTEPDLFYHVEGPAWVSEAVILSPGAGLRSDTFFNGLGIGGWHRACRLDGLFLALQGSGQIEVRVYQVQTGRSWERLCCEVCTLSQAGETVFDLSHYTLNGAAGVIWFEIRASDAKDSATLTGARYLTRAMPDPAMRLALCLPRPATSSARFMQARLEAWCAGPGKPAQAQLLPGEAGASPLAQLRAARMAGFSHALLLDPATVIAPETLSRVLAFLTLARTPQTALGAAVLDPAEKWLMGANGLTLSTDGALLPLFAATDLRDRMAVVDMECEMAQAGPADLQIQPEFLALSLAVLPQAGEDTDTATDTATALQAAGVVVHHLTGIVARRDLDDSAADSSAVVTLQNLIFPEQGICTEPDMFFHVVGAAGYQEKTGRITLEPGAIALFDTYFNALNIGKWHATCALEGLFLGLTGRGRVLVKVFHAIPDRSWELLCNDIVTLSEARETRINLSHYTKNAVTGMIYFEIHAIGPGVSLSGARYMAPGQANPQVRLALSITTFKREAEVENTARRMAKYLATAEFRDHLHVFIIDNGDSAKIPTHPQMTRLANANLGGAGGFTRGLIEAGEAGYSHVLFMDDDASIPMEALHRTYAFLTLSKDPKAAVAGAMISNTDKWRMWENGATFDRNCRPLFNGVDLRNWQEVMHMEFASAQHRSAKMYGGWWFFAFPIAEVTRHPFPFFVRGDDVNFGLANDFHITTLNGVVSFADDFSDKESPMTLYLDLRNHMVQHLALEKMEIGGLAVARIGIGFYLRNLAKFQYETIEAILMAWRDVMKGPEFFASNPDASAQRAAVKALTKAEVWRPVGDIDLTERRRFWAGHGWRYKFYRASLNGHLLPFFNRWGNRVVLPPRERSQYAPIWGASRITYLNSARDKAYTVTQSKTRFVVLTTQLLWLTLRMVLGYKSLRAKYRKGYPEITTRAYWNSALALEQADSVAQVEPADIPATGVPAA